MNLVGLTIVLLGTCFVQGLRVPTSQIFARDSAHGPGSTFTVTRPGTSGLSATVNAVTTDNDTDISSVRDIMYMAAITVAGKEYQVQIDTGSSDLWIKSNNMAGVRTSNISGNATYGTGWAAGPISRANVSFAGFDVSSQALIMATSANNPILNWGAEGLLGLGLNSLSTIDTLVNGTGESWGRTLLYNIFAQSPKTPNFIAFLLQRSENTLKPSSEGSFTIGELEPEYEAAINATEAIPTWPLSNPTRWTLLLDSYDTTGAVLHAFTSRVSGVADGQAVGLLDSGTSYSYASEEFCRSLYSSIPGATFSSTIGQWVVPCKEEVNLGFIIGGRRFPINPLDITSPSLTRTGNSTCYGTFIPYSFSAGAGEFDILLGATFLRNVYSLYDLGDFVDKQSTVMGNPYMKLLSITNATAASEEFHRLRGGSANDANRISNAQSSSGSTSSSPMLFVRSAKIDLLIRYAKALISLLAVMTAVLVSAVGVLVYFVFFRRRRNPTIRIQPGESSLSSLGLGPLHPPGPAYQPVPSSRNSAIPELQTPVS